MFGVSIVITILFFKVFLIELFIAILNVLLNSDSHRLKVLLIVLFKVVLIERFIVIFSV